MKIIKNKFFICVLLLLMGLESYADICYDTCGRPYTCNPGFPDPTACPPPGGPIDENIFILVCVALLFGIYIVYKHQENKKTAP
jgi:hypothetical protein